MLRLIGLPLLAATLLQAIPGRGRPAWRALQPLDRAVIAWALVSIASAALGVSPRLSLMGEIEQREGVLTTLALAGLYAAARRSLTTREHARNTLWLVAVAVTIAAAYGLVQIAGLDPLHWANTQHYPSGQLSALRPFATLGNPILLGALCAAAVAITIARSLDEPASAWWLAPATALLACVTVATLSRSAWLATLAAGAVALGLAWRIPDARARRGVGLALGAAVLAMLAWSALLLRAPVLARLAESPQDASVSTSARIEILRAALAIARAHPILGTGPDTFGLLFPSVQTPAFWRTEWLGIPVHAHSVALQVLATLGVLGALAGLAWLVALGAVLRRGVAARGVWAAVAAALASLVVAGALNPVGPAGAALFVVLSALAVNLVQDAAGQPRAQSAPHLRWAVLLVIFALTIPTWRELRALAHAGQAHGALLARVTADATAGPALARHAQSQAALATDLAAGDDELWRLRADAALADTARAGGTASTTASARDAATAAARAVALEPLRASNLQRLANARAAGGDGIRADSAFARASALAPSDALILVDQARAQLERGDWRAAGNTARRIVALYPEAATGHTLEAAAALGAGDHAAARAALTRALAARWEADATPSRGMAEALLRALTVNDAGR